MATKYLAENKKTEEIYDCNLKVLIANITSHYRVDDDKALEMLNNAIIDNPLELSDCLVWKEN